MRKILLLLLFCSCAWTVARAQLPPGTIAPDFTATDIDGNTYNLYDLLDQGKTVYLDVSATWCGPCWNYHNSHALADIWDEYGPPGTGEAFVFMIEGDPNTNTACLYGPSGCVGGTQGDWTAGTPYPIVDDASIADLYAINYYPTIYIICPANKKVYETGQLPATGLWNFRENTCPDATVSTTINNLKHVRCHGTSTGSIDISVSGGAPPHSYQWSNGATTQDLNNIPVGTYTVTVTSSNGWVGESDPIEVEGPAQPLTVSVVETTPVGCNGLLGSITVDASGGWDENYTFVWQNGQNGPTAFSLGVGNHTVSVTDNNLCTKTLTTNLPPPVYPTASVAPPPVINCAQASIQLNGSGSSSGSNYSYLWFASNGGNIVSGETTLTPTVNAAGNYTLKVTDQTSTCASFATTGVTADLTPPSANAGPAGSVTCAQPSTTLQGSGSSGNNFTYLWTASNGGNITSGGTTLTPTVNAAGTYTLKVTNTLNGCTQTSATSVAGNNTPPTVSTTNGTLTCTATAVTLTTSTNATAPVFAWTGPNGFTSDQQSPSVTASGTYLVTVTEPSTGCIGNATASVTANTAAPGATATGGTLTCTATSVTLTGSSAETNVLYAWTGPGGFTSNLQNPTATVTGAYNLVVTNPGNGCTSGAAATVALNTLPPTAAAAAPGNLNCNTAQLQLSGAGSSQGAGFTYLWTTANGHLVSGETTLTPLVDQTGTYVLNVTDAANGCTATATASVSQSPPVSATIGSQTNISCFGGSNGSATAVAGGGNGSFGYAWSTGATGATVGNLPAGTYSVSITDGENCTATASVVLSQPDVLAANATATSQSGLGIDDGTATAAPTGGTSAYTYLWSQGATTATITGLAPGNYSVTVTDANGCTALQTVTVNAFNCAISSSITGTNVTCFGAANGTAAVSVTGAAEPVAYAWSNGGTGPGQSSLAAGSYSVSILDANNCPAQLSIAITEPAALQANATATGETSAGANDGTATAAPTGGTAPFGYAWSTGATTATITGLAPGTYAVVVTDGNGCTSTQSVVVNGFNCNLAPDISVAQVSCAGLANGSATVTLAGGTAPFAYLWNNGATTATIAGLAPGSYLVTITDANDCQALSTATITEPAALTAGGTVISQPVCPDDATGEAAATASGGTGSYAYLWSNGATGSTLTGLAPGAYSVVVSDANACSAQATVTIAATDNEAPTVSMQPATVALDANGEASVSLSALNVQAADNCNIVSYVWTNNFFNCTQLGEQVVTLVVTDQAGLAATATATVTVVDNLAPTVTCPNSLTVCPKDNLVTYPGPVAQDNCLGNGGTLNLESGLLSGSVFPTGSTTQVYSFTDASGNQGTCSFEVIVLETVLFGNPQITNDVNNQGTGSINITVSGNTGPFTYQWVNENGEVVGDQPLVTGLTAGSYTLHVFDANGCQHTLPNVVLTNTVRTQEPAWLTGVQIRPNPTAGPTRVRFSTVPAAGIAISLLDATGRTVLSLHHTGSAEALLDCSDVPGGLYLLRFSTGSEVGMRKLVVGGEK